MKDIDYTRKKIFTKGTLRRVPLVSEVTQSGNTLSVFYTSRREKSKSKSILRKPVEEVKEFFLRPKSKSQDQSKPDWECDYGKICIRCGCDLGGFSNPLLAERSVVRELCRDCEQQVAIKSNRVVLNLTFNGNNWHAPVKGEVSYFNKNILPRKPRYLKKKVRDTFTMSKSVQLFVDRIHEDYVQWVRSINAHEHMNIVRRKL